MAVASSKEGAEAWGKLGVSGAGIEAWVSSSGLMGLARGSGVVMAKPFDCRVVAFVWPQCHILACTAPITVPATTPTSPRIHP